MPAIDDPRPGQWVAYGIRISPPKHARELRRTAVLLTLSLTHFRFRRRSIYTRYVKEPLTKKLPNHVDLKSDIWARTIGEAWLDVAVTR